jgi:preprotein translocase subunit SecY
VAMGLPIVPEPGIHFQFFAIMTLLAGTMSLVWIGEKITEHGLGNGLSLIIYASIISGLPSAISGTFALFKSGDINIFFLIAIMIFIATAIYFVVYVEKAQRRIPVNYSSKKNESFHNHKGTLPFKVNMAGVMPPIVASTIILIPGTMIAMAAENNDSAILIFFSQLLTHGSLFFLLMFCALIMFFSFFLTSLQQDPEKLSEKLKNSGTFIKGVRPGINTSIFLRSTIRKMSFIGGLYLVFICLIPEILIKYWNVPFYFGGTSLLILVTVALDWKQKISSILGNNAYKKIEEKLMDDFKVK